MVCAKILSGQVNDLSLFILDAPHFLSVLAIRTRMHQAMIGRTTQSVTPHYQWRRQ
jgi:hypothetical protein